MGTGFRAIAIFVEVVILMGVIYSLFVGAKLTVFDLGLDYKYQRFINLVLIIFGCLVLVFFVSHLITFYPEILLAL